MYCRDMYDLLPRKKYEAWIKKTPKYEKVYEVAENEELLGARCFYGMCYSMHLYLNDGMHFIYNGKIYRVGKNTLFIRRPGDVTKSKTLCGQIHRYGLMFCDVGKKEGKNEFIKNIDVNSENTDEFEPFRKVTDQEVKKIRHSVERIIDLEESKEAIYINERNSVARELIEMIDKIYEERKMIPPVGTAKTVQKSSEIVKYIWTHTNSDLSIDALSEKFYISKFHLCRRFKEETGYTLQETVALLRMIRAIEYLNRGFSVAQTSFMLGINNPTNFTAAFKKATGITPKKYSKRFDE